MKTVQTSSNPFLRLAGALAAAASVALAAACGGDAKSAAPADEKAGPAKGARPLWVSRPEQAAKPPKPSGPPSMEFVPPRFELGVLEPNERVDLEFEVFNRTDRPFSITTAQSGCKCVTVKFDRDVIQPGKAAKVRSRVTATSSGQRTSSVQIRVSDPRSSVGRMEIHYVVVPEVLLLPRKVEFGRVDAGSTAEQTVRVTLHLPSAIPDPPLEPFLQHDLPIALELDPPTITQTAGGLRDLVATLHLKLRSDEPLPPFQTAVIFQAKTPKTFRTKTLPVSGYVAPSWRFERPSLSFGIVRVGEETTRSVRFLWSGEQPPEIESLEADAPELAVSHTTDPANRSFVVTVKCKAARPGRIEAAVRLKTALDDEPSVLRVSARVR